MNIRKLVIFYETARSLNMSKVAKELYISQPSISQSIAELESEIDIKLFDRIGKKLYLTNEGEIFFQYVRRILNLYDEAINEAKAFSKDNIGKIVIGASSTIGIYIMPYVVKKFNEIAKKIEVEVIIDNKSNIEELLLNNKIDIAFMEGNVSIDEFIVKEIWKDELVFISSIDCEWKNRNCITVEDLEKSRLILREKESGTRQIFDLFLNSQGIIYNNFLELSDTQAIINYVKLNMGISCVSYIAVKDNERQGEINIHRLEKNKIERSLNMAIHKDKHISKIMGYFIKFCEKIDIYE